MTEPPEVKTETVETRVPSTARGWRLVICLAFITLGLALVALGVFYDLHPGVRALLVVGGLGLAGTFGLATIAASRVGGTKNVPGADLPQDSTVTTTTITRRGFPKRGKMPSKHGKPPGR